MLLPSILVYLETEEVIELGSLLEDLRVKRLKVVVFTVNLLEALKGARDFYIFSSLFEA